MTKAELEEQIEQLWERLEQIEEVKPWRHWCGPTIPLIPEPRTREQFELAYRLMHPAPGGNPRCTW